MRYRFLSDEQRQGARYELAQTLEREHYRLELQLRQLRQVAPEAPEVETSEQQQASLEAQIDSILEDGDEPR